MTLDGKIPYDDGPVRITEDAESVTNCSEQGAETSGRSICNNEIRIPVNIVYDVQFVQISVNDSSLVLCEVQVFAGKLNGNKALSCAH